MADLTVTIDQDVPLITDVLLLEDDFVVNVGESQDISDLYDDTNPITHSLAFWQSNNPTLPLGIVGIIRGNQLSESPTMIVFDGISSFNDLYVNGLNRFRNEKWIFDNVVNPFNASIDAENNARLIAQSALGNDILTEAATRAFIDSGLSTNINNLGTSLSGETYARISADALLQIAIDDLSSFIYSGGVQVLASNVFLDGSIAGLTAYEAYGALTEIMGIISGLGGGGGTGDMSQLIYDSDADGVVNDSDKLGGHLPAYFATDSDLASETLNRIAADALKEDSISAGSTGEYFSYDKTWKPVDASEITYYDSFLLAPLTGMVQEAMDAVANVALSAANDIAYHQNLSNNPHFVTKAQVGLGSADNTSDINKPVSTAQAAADAVNATAISAHTGLTNNPHNVSKAQVGLGSADNTSDVNKPVSTAQAAADAVNAAAIAAHAALTNNPHSVTKTQVGLGNVDNTTDLNKPVSTLTAAAIAAAISTKQDGDTDLSVIASLVASNDDFIQRKSGAWANRSVSQVKTDLAISNIDNTSDLSKPLSTAALAANALKQDLDSDLTAIASLVPSNDDVIQRKSGNWVNRTIAQLKADFALVWNDIASKPATFNAPNAAFDYINHFISGTVISGLETTLVSGGNIGLGTVELNRPGVLNFTTNASATGASGMRFGHNNCIAFGGGATFFESAMKLDILSNTAGSQAYAIRHGFSNSVNLSTEGTNCVLFRYTDNVNGGKWQCVTRNNNTETITDSGITVATGTWYKLRIEINAAGTAATFYINGTAVATGITANMPTGVTRLTGVLFGINKTTGTTTVTMPVDYYQVNQQFTTPT